MWRVLNDCWARVKKWCNVILTHTRNNSKISSDLTTNWWVKQTNKHAFNWIFSYIGRSNLFSNYHTYDTNHTNKHLDPGKSDTDGLHFELGLWMVCLHIRITSPRVRVVVVIDVVITRLPTSCFLFFRQKKHKLSNEIHNRVCQSPITLFPWTYAHTRAHTDTHIQT